MTYIVCRELVATLLPQQDLRWSAHVWLQNLRPGSCVGWLASGKLCAPSFGTSKTH